MVFRCRVKRRERRWVSVPSAIARVRPDQMAPPAPVLPLSSLETRGVTATLPLSTAASPSSSPSYASPSPAAKPSLPYLLDPAAPVAPALLASRTQLRRARRRRWSLPQLCAAGIWWIYSHRIHRRSRARDSTITFASLDLYSRRLDGPHGITTDLQFFSLLIASSIPDLVSALMTAEDCVKSKSSQ